MFLGFDLSTQQLKLVVIDESLKVLYEAAVDFDVDLPHYGTRKGVHLSGKEVRSPVAMWIEALDLVLLRLSRLQIDLKSIQAISGSGQQHGSVFWSVDAEDLLSKLDADQPLVTQLASKALAYELSPNWQDASTHTECDDIEACIGGADELARITGNKAHHRFTGPQILRIRKRRKDIYDKTARISLISSFLCSLLLGTVAPIDISDICGGNLWDIQAECYNEEVLQCIAGSFDTSDLKQKLGPVCRNGAAQLGPISPYYQKKYGFSSSCQIIPFTGDNPATILALPLQERDAIVSLGTSTTLLLSTHVYLPDPAYHVFAHPITKGNFMVMLCYKNGSLAREVIRDAINLEENQSGWDAFDHHALTADTTHKLALYYTLPEIIPNVDAGTYRFTSALIPATWNKEFDARCILESQFLDIRMRSHSFFARNNTFDDPRSQADKIYVVGGSARNESIVKVLGEVMGSKGIYRPTSSNACAAGGANKAAYAMLNHGESFEDFVSARWTSQDAPKVAAGYNAARWHFYGGRIPILMAAQELVSTH